MTVTKYLSRKIYLFVFGSVALVGNSIQVYCSYIAKRQFARFEEFSNYNHVMLGIFLFLLMKAVFDRIDLNRLSGVLSFTDHYSYEVYLTHHFIILGPFSLMSMTSMVWLNIVIIIVLTVGLAFVVKYIASFMEHLIFTERPV